MALQIVAIGFRERYINITRSMIDTIDSIEEAGETDFLIIDLEGTAGEIVGYAIGRSDLTVIPMSASSMDARQAAKASQLVKRMAKTFKIDLPYVFAFCRTNAAIVTREWTTSLQLALCRRPRNGFRIWRRA